MKPTLRHDKNIFTSYVGLTAGGYTLAETKENKELIRKIRVIAWDNGTESWNRVFEESFMRAVSIWVCNCNDIEIAVSKACYYASDGFI